MTSQTMSIAEYSDAALVTQSVAGNRDAFGQIVAHHQSLICSLAYSATGSLTQSEDIAQETFVTAWKHLPELREPAKLRAWLCGIARNLIGKTLRRDAREPVHVAGPLEEANESPSHEPLPSDHVIGKEEEAILWRSLERIPETYREPLVLFYREHQSVERVADELELTQDAVKQRLSRGRKLLQEQVLAFVEGALEQTSPGKAVMTTSAKAAVVGATAAKGAGAAKSAVLSGMANVILVPVASLLGLFFAYRLDTETARSPQRRGLIVKFYRVLVLYLVVSFLGVLSLMLGFLALKTPLMVYAELLFGILALSFLFAVTLAIWFRRNMRNITQKEITAGCPVPLAVPLFEYRSKLTLFGLPLVHIRLRGGLERGPVKAWIAGGDSAIGVIFAFGAVAIAPVSVGGIAAGLLTLGGFAIGIASLGGLSLGWWALGAMAVGIQADGACAIGWWGAQGAAAVAHDFASGVVAWARHGNDAESQAYFANSAFFQTAQAASRHALWMLLFCMTPLVFWWLDKKQRKALH
jgi:RNA polymerase sigma factor (sigma-70 family)